MSIDYQSLELIKEQRVEAGDFLTLHYTKAVEYICSLVGKPIQENESYELMTLLVYIRQNGNDGKGSVRDVFSAIEKYTPDHFLISFEDLEASNLIENPLDCVWIGASTEKCISIEFEEKLAEVVAQLTSIDENVEVIASIGRHPYSAYRGITAIEESSVRVDPKLRELVVS